MGQLEKYGLYVLCLVIFLILGVTIWGDGGVSAARRAPATSGLNASSSASASASPSAGPRGADLARPTPAGNAGVPNLQELMRPVVRPVATPRDTKSADAGGTLNAGAGSPAGNGGGSAVQPPGKDAGKPVAEVQAVAVVRPTYKVQRGDTLGEIAKAKLGSSSLHTEITRLNPSVRPERLQVGQVLVLPATTELASSPTVADSSRDAGSPRDAVVAYTVGKGDTLEGIARRQLGDRRRVGELQELNPGIEPKNLRIGQKLRLPKK